MHSSTAKALTVEAAVSASGPNVAGARLPLQARQCVTHDSARALDVSHSVRCGDEASLKLRRREIDAAFQTSMEKTGEHFQIASLRAGEIDNGRGSKEQTKHRTEPVKRDIDVRVLDCVTRKSFKLRAQLVDQFLAVDSFEFAQLRQTSSHCDGISRQGSCLIHRTIRGKLVHDFGAAAKCADR
jgi:hypothetical protein